MTQTVEESIRALRIIISGLIGGLVMFSLVCAVIGPIARSADPQLTMALLAGVTVLVIGCAVGYTTLRRQMIAKLKARASEIRQAKDPGVLVLEPYRGFVVAGGGLIEGPGFFALVTYLLTGHVAAVGVVIVVLALLVAHMPSAAKVQQLVDEATQL